MKKRKLKRYYHRLDFQITITTVVVLATVFSFLSLYITLTNAFKSDLDIKTNIFALPSLQSIGANAAFNFSTAWGAISKSFVSTILLALVGAFGNCVLGAVLAYIFTFKQFPFKEVIFSAFISVMLLPSIMGMPVLVPFVKNTLGLGQTYIGYLLPNWAGGQVAALFLFRTFFSQHSRSIFESAQISGASDFQILMGITLPMALPIILFHFVGLFSSYYNEYLWASLILGDKMTLMPKLLSFQELFSGQQQSGAIYAMYVLSSLPLVVTSAISMKYFKGGEFASGMKL